MSRLNTEPSSQPERQMQPLIPRDILKVYIEGNRDYYRFNLNNPNEESAYREFISVLKANQIVFKEKIFNGIAHIILLLNEIVTNTQQNVKGLLAPPDERDDDE